MTINGHRIFWRPEFDKVIVEGILAGKSSVQLARRLKANRRTIQQRWQRLTWVFKAKSNAELALICWQNGLIDYSPPKPVVLLKTI